jgi:hypothetical protein
MTSLSKSFWATMAVFTILVGTHEGEFWPFSIYPMFSQAGNPWDRAVLVRLDSAETAIFSWESIAFDDLPGDVAPLRELGADNIDYANYVGKTKEWSPERAEGLRRMLALTVGGNESYVAYKVHGRRDAHDGIVRLSAVPVAQFTMDENRTGGH